MGWAGSTSSSAPTRGARRRRRAGHRADDALEYDDARAGDFDALKLLPENVTAVLGLITTKRGEMEERDDLHARIEDAAQHLPLDRLALSTQCGFASDADGNEIGPDAQWAKLELVVDTAEEVWGALVP